MSLYELPTAQYPQIRDLISPESCGAVYPLSVVDRTQDGRIYTDGKAFLLHHHCGFSFLFGDTDSAFLDTVGEMLLQPPQGKRMLLFASNDKITQHFADARYTQDKRLFFRYPAQIPPHSDIHAECITAAHLASISGKITPAFSWNHAEQFLENGCGYCIMQDDIPTAWAFSAAVSEQEIDIGVETDVRFRKRGFAYAAAAAMIAEILLQKKTPVWACHINNPASQKLAAALGFIPCGECTVIQRNVST